MLLANLDLWQLHVPAPVALAVVAVIGYLIGRRRTSEGGDVDARARREMRRAKAVAKSLEAIAKSVRKDLAKHHSSVARFKTRVGQLSQNQNEAAWKELCDEAENILGPTLQLAAEIAHAYDQIRQQSHHLMSFTEVRTDPLTGVSNRRALDETLKTLVALKNRYEVMFSVAMFDLDHFKQLNDEQGHLAGDQCLKTVATIMDEAVRETDVVTRYGGEEFVIVMPQTDLSGACIFAERLRRTIEKRTKVTISGGVACVFDSETPEQLLERADNALYTAKLSGRNLVYCHDGETPQLATSMYTVKTAVDDACEPCEPDEREPAAASPEEAFLTK